MLAFQRVRWDFTQQELADEVDIDQIQVSNLENGVPSGLSDDKVDALFERLGLADADGHAAYLKWWSRHAKSL